MHIAVHGPESVEIIPESGARRFNYLLVFEPQYPFDVKFDTGHLARIMHQEHRCAA